MSPQEMDALVAQCSEAELGVALFTGKLHHLLKAGVDFGISETQLHDLLVAINTGYELLTSPTEGAPN